MDKATVLRMLKEDFVRFHNESFEISRALQDMKQDTKNYIDSLMSQLTNADVAPLLAKTPKMPKKRPTRIKSIPEYNEEDTDNSMSLENDSNSFKSNNLISDTSEIRANRSRRIASAKAADMIKKQQSINLTVKLRNNSKDESEELCLNKTRQVRSKRTKDSMVSSEDDDIRPSKQSKIENKKNMSKTKVAEETEESSCDSLRVSEENEAVDLDQNRTAVKRKLTEQNEEENITLIEKSTEENNLSDDEPIVKKANYSKSPPPKNDIESKYLNKLERISEASTESNQIKKPEERITRSSSSSLINAQSSKKFKMNNLINETIEMSNNDTVTSMYEDALGKPVPMMNSTMNSNTTVTLDKIMNATVLIEPLSTKKILNETITIKKSSFKEPLSRKNSLLKEINAENNTTSKKSIVSSTLKKSLQNQKGLKTEMQKQIEKFNELITDDESSPERKDKHINQETLVNPYKRITRSNNSSMSDEEILRTPLKFIQSSKDYKMSSAKSKYKKSALFSPYAKDSVKKRVQAFEQVATSPKQNEQETVRVTRLKTRALAAASFIEDPALAVKQKLARKSLAKAKKISLAKQAREYDDVKENEYSITVKTSKGKSSLEKSAQKLQQKSTPLGKNRMLQIPSSLNKLQHTPSNTQNFNIYSKPLTASRGNIVTHVDSFIQPIKSATKQYDRSAEEKRRRIHDEDARRKREELLKAQAEEKRRKREEKELKNKLAREAKEKLDYEKRMKAEREKEEKAKLAQQLQEKQKEEIEKRRIAQMQRALEKEERRRQEELVRMQRLQEQEEQERLLAEQKRREQEAEKRKQAEMRLKIQMEQKAKAKALAHAHAVALAQAQAQALAQAQKQAPNNYKIDSDPDEEESDDESKPKHQIPHWASKSVRQIQLTMQQYIPMNLVLKFFDARKCTPDLRDLFIGIDPKKLKRSSSAIWKTPPRFSMMNCSIIKDEI